MVAALLVPLSSARWLITSWRPGLASSSGKGYSTDSGKDDKDMEGRVFERVFGQMSRNYDSTRRAAAAFFVLPGHLALLGWAVAVARTRSQARTPGGN